MGFTLQKFSSDNYFLLHRDTFDPLNVNFTNDELVNCIRNLKDNKAPGPDKLTNERSKGCFIIIV